MLSDSLIFNDKNAVRMFLISNQYVRFLPTTFSFTIYTVVFKYMHSCLKSETFEQGEKTSDRGNGLFFITLTKNKSKLIT
nr:hypothetical protein [Mucilaginibacter sp. FT3.2]